MKPLTVYWIGALALVVIGLIGWFMLVQPSPTAVEQAVRPLAPLPQDVLGSQGLEILKNRQANGNLPVSSEPPNPPRNDPFSQ